MLNDPRHPNCIHPLCGCAGTANCEADPMNTPLPCDVVVGGGTFNKGVKLGTFVKAAQRWHQAAHPDFYTLTDAEKAANLARLQVPAPGVPPTDQTQQEKRNG